MAALQSAEMKLALKLIKDDKIGVYLAASLAGITPSAIYKSLKNKEKKKVLTKNKE